MAKSYRTGKRSSAAASSSWSQIVEACRAVVERAQGRREMGRFGLAVDASTDTLGRMLDDPQYGGWTGPRILAMRAWEEDEYSTHQIRTARGGTAPEGRADEVERDADETLLSALGLSRKLAELRPGGYSRAESRVILPLYEEMHAKIGKALVNLKARQRSGK
jgi:tellurite resistance protein